MKHWHREQTAPLGALRRMSGQYYSAVGARGDYERARARHGDDHPATRAARGRLLFHEGWVPSPVWQPSSPCIERVAWYRESGAIEGYLNRAERKHARAPSDVTHASMSA